MDAPDLQLRARRHAALGEPARLKIVEELARTDRSPVELRERFDLASNLLAHHLDVLEDVGLVSRRRSSGDGRRRYVRLNRDALVGMVPGGRVQATDALFVCSANSARSQLAAAVWTDATGTIGTSAGTHPAATVHPEAVAAAERAGLDLTDAMPTVLDLDIDLPALVVTVCDQAHEELGDQPDWLHWSIPDPVEAGTRRAFDEALDTLRQRIDDLVDATETAA